MRATLEHLTVVVGDLTGRAAGPGRPAALNAWRTQDWHGVLLDVPLDERAYADRFQVSRRTEIEGLWRWWSERDATGPLEPRAAGFLGFYLLTLVAMHCSDRMRFHGDAALDVTLAGTTAQHLSAALVADPDVRRAIVALHDPDARLGTRPGVSKGSPASVPASPATRAEWAAIDVASLEFYRHGTTSIILTGRAAAPSRGRTATFALKCLIHPYRTIPAITAATRSYLAEHGRLDAEESSPTVRVWASHDSWILMDLIRGRTLGEHLAHRSAARPAAPAREILRAVDTDGLRELGGALLTALTDLEREGRRHDDLTPSNIIVEEEREPGRFRLRFVDLGVSYLHTRSIVGQVQGDGAYAAPEVRRDGVGHPLADLYSLGALLISVAGIPHSADGTVPDQFYVASVGLARLLEDLTDAEPCRRLLVTPVDPAGPTFEQVGRVFRDEVAILEQDGRERPRTRLQRLQDLSPGAGTVARQRRTLQVRSNQVRDSTGAAHLRQARRLRRWAWLCAVLLWCATALVVTWWSRDLGLSWQAKWFEMADEMFGSSGSGLAFFDDVRADDYPIPDPWGNLPVRLVTLTFALVSARLYLNVFAELSTVWAMPRGRSARVRAVVAEVGLRSLAVLPAVYVVVPTLVQRDWWPLGTLVGHVTFAVVVQACLWFAWDTNARARAAGLSSVPRGEIATLGRLAAWQPTVAVYLVPIVGIGTLLSLGLVQDELVYACFVSLINLGIFYPKSAGTDAPYIRAGMNRAALAAERLERLERSEPARLR